jgi:putative ABC transport system permease protein
MAWVKRFANLFRQGRIDREIEEELHGHFEEAIERGRPSEEARRAFGGELHYRERSRDLKLVPWLESLAKDGVFGWRQLNKHRASSAAAILSLALAIGATTAAFRLVDAVLLRALPVAQPERLSFLSISYINRDGQPRDLDDFSYPAFRQYRDTVADRADLMVIGTASARQDAVFGAGAAAEKPYRQYFSGNVFGIFGLQPALGRLLTPNDDKVPGSQAVAVLSYDYWTRRFARDPHVLGKKFRMGEESDGLPPERKGGDQFEIVGVAPKGFTGTEPGVVTDVFIPAMMNARVIDNDAWGWFRIWVRPKPGFSIEQVRQPLQAAYAHEMQEWGRTLQGDPPKQMLASYLTGKVQLLPASAGASRIQREYRRPLLILAALVVLVLLLACANTGNLMAAQAASRAREMALRVSIGAGQWRLIQLVLVESALVAAIASALGMLFAAWAAPWVVPMLHVPGDPVRLVLDTGWREVAFSIALALSVSLLFGLAPALRASSIQPMRALRGGEDPHGRRRLMNGLLAAQMAFCVLVQFVAGLFVTTFERLSNRPLGFSPEHVLVIYADAAEDEPARVWTQVADGLRQTPGVVATSLAGWPLLSEDTWTRTVRVPGHASEPRSAYFLDVSRGFFETMRIGWIDGRDFRPGDAFVRVTGGQPQAGVGIVNEAFARSYFNGRNPVGRLVEIGMNKNLYAPMEIVGYVRDAAYATLREPVRPTVYVPLGGGFFKTLLVRTAGDPLPLAPVLRREITLARPDFQVHQIQPQTNFVDWHLVRERLLAVLSLFFAVVALVLAAIGLYGVLNYAVAQRRRETGIRMALGAGSAHVVRGITAEVAGMVSLGAALGVAAGLASGRFVETLLYEVKATDAGSVAAPLVALMATALLAAVPPAIRAVRIDPAKTLRSE